jgi:hypothetical protein
MPNSSIRLPRPNLTGQILAFAMLDGFGLFCVGIGASWFVAGEGAILSDFPSSAVEAVACTAGGVAVMLWAVGRIRREIAKQKPEMQARHDKPIAAHLSDTENQPKDDA